MFLYQLIWIYFFCMGIIVPLFHGKYLLIRMRLNTQATGIGVIKQKDNKEKHPDEDPQHCV